MKSRSRTDPLRAFPTELTQRLFSLLTVKELATCSRVSKKWNTSQSINYGRFKVPIIGAVADVISLVQALQKGELPRRQLATRQVDQARVERELGEC